jgi:hypothetical protein
MFLHVDGVTHLGGYQLRLAFNNGIEKDVDLLTELHGEAFEPLRDPQTFRRVQVNAETGTIEWPNGADFAPEFLFELGTPVQQHA